MIPASILFWSLADFFTNGLRIMTPTQRSESMGQAPGLKDAWYVSCDCGTNAGAAIIFDVVRYR
ncbi:MAG: hypothetical protein WCE90_04755 [Candidatus Zixiibacteriota bacterium]